MCFDPGSIKLKLDESKRLSENGTEQETDKFSVPEMTGVRMAIDVLQSNGFDGFKYKDKVRFECTGIQKNSDPQQNAMPEFEINVERA